MDTHTGAMTSDAIMANSVFREAIRQGREQAAQWEAECLWPDIIAEHGSVEAWLADCRQRRRADGERRMARLIMMLMTDGAGRPQGTLRPPERSRMLANRPLAAFWFSVISATGDDGFAEERRRIRDRQRQAMRAVEPEGRMEAMEAMEAEAIKALMPTYRVWGKALIDAGAVSDADIDGAFLPPGCWWISGQLRSIPGQFFGKNR